MERKSRGTLDGVDLLPVHLYRDDIEELAM
jgi:hypothetical protein